MYNVSSLGVIDELKQKYGWIIANLQTCEKYYNQHA